MSSLAASGPAVAGGGPFPPRPGAARAGRREALLAFAASALLAILFFSDLLTGGRVLITSDFRWYSPWSSHPEIAAAPGFRFDSAQTYYPRRLLARQAILAGEAPLWNPHAAMGMPLLADYQTAPFYPVNLLLLPIDPLDAMGWFMIIHFALAGFFTYLFLRDLDASPLAAGFGALAFQWNGYFVSYYGHPTHIATGVWLPLIALLLRRALLAPRGFPVLLTLALTSLLLAGFPQTLMVALYALAAWGCYVLLFESTEAPRARALAALRLLPAGAIAAALAAPELLPTAELSRLSAHDAFTHASVWPMNDIPWITYLKAFFPNLFGNPVEGTSWLAWAHGGLPHPNDLGAVAFAGVLTPLLAAGALATAGARGRRAETAFFAAFVIVPALFLSFRPASALLWRLPGWGFSTEIHRVEFLAFFGAALLAARGLDAARGAGPAGVHSRRVLVGGAILLALFLAAFSIGGGRILAGIAEEMIAVVRYAGRGAQSLWVAPKMLAFLTGDLAGWISEIRSGIVASVLVAACGVALILLARGRRAVLFGALLLILHAADLTAAARRYWTPQPSAGVFVETEGIAALEAAMRERPGRLFRFGDTAAIPPNIPSVFGLDDAGGYNALLPLEFGEYWNTIETGAYSRGREVIAFQVPSSLESPLFRRAGARFLVTGRDADVEKLLAAGGGETAPGGYRLLHRGDLNILETDRAIPRVRVVHRWVVEPDRRRAIRKLASGEVSIEVAAVLERDPGIAAAGAPPAPGKARIVAESFNRVEVECRTESAALLVLSDQFYPGWEARVDGRPTEVIRCDAIYRAVALPAGEHRVVFRFRSPPFRTGCRLALAGAACLLVLGVVSRRTVAPAARGS